MKVIVAGFSKTGTKSMAVALSELGYEVYDMLEHFWYHGKQWQRLLVEGGVVEDFKEMYANVDAVLDVPAFFFWRQIHEAFPDSKIILTTRDKESWFKSWKKQTEDVNGNFFYHLMETVSPTGRRYFRHLKAFCPPTYGFSVESPWRKIGINKMVLTERYVQHYQNVLQNAPKDKLLVYDVREGWEPLCEFLGVDVPNKEFPHENKGGKVIEMFIRNNPIMQRMVHETLVIVCAIFIFSVLMAILLFYVF